MLSSHNRIIAQAAQEVLGPLGFRQKNRSRTWMEDRGWWLIIVEFQPSSWSKGSYLNVAAHWLWKEQEYISFDYGNRVESFVKFISNDQFSGEAFRLAELAAARAMDLWETFTSIDAAAEVLTTRERELDQGSWSAYHAGMALGMSGQLTAAVAMFDTIRDDRVTPALDRIASGLSSAADFRRTADIVIQNRRKSLGLMSA